MTLVPPPPTRLQQVATDHPLPSWQIFARIIMAALALLLIWAAFARLDEVVTADGEVVPEGKVKVIQHLEGGIVREFHVHEGDVVREGQPLLQLDLAPTAINRDELQVRLDGYVLARARLQAEVGGASAPHFPPEEAARRPRLVESEQQNFEARHRALESAVAVLADQVRQKALEIEELQAKQRAISSSLKLARAKLAMSSDLLTSGLTSKMDHVQLQREVESLDGDLSSLVPALPRTEAALAEAKARIDDEHQRYVRQAQQDLGEAEVNIARTRELFNQAADQQFRTAITSPIDGVVKNMRINTVGGVVRPGEAIMEIVPIKDRLDIEAKLAPADRGYVEVGQKALVKVSAYDFTRYGGLDGTVTMVAPDTTVPQDGKSPPYYRVTIQTEKSHLGEAEGLYPITPGMQASIDIKTGTRTVLHYLIKPVLKLKHEAFREP